MNMTVRVEGAYKCGACFYGLNRTVWGAVGDYRVCPCLKLTFGLGYAAYTSYPHSQARLRNPRPSAGSGCVCVGLQLFRDSGRVPDT